MHSFPLARYRFKFTVAESLRLPEYAGSTLRGAFGHALMQLSGISKQDIQSRTSLFLQSPYAHVFDPQQVMRSESSLHGLQQLPVPYVIEAPLTGEATYLPGDTLSFDLVLTGKALAHLAIIVLAWRRAFLRGIGAGDGKAELLLVEQVQPDNRTEIIFDADNPVIRAHNGVVTVPDFPGPCDVHLHLQTPLRLQQRGKILGPRDMVTSVFLRHLIRRVTIQAQHQNAYVWSLDVIRNLNLLAEQVMGERNLVWKNWSRYSSRQKQTMELGGVTGNLYLRAVPAELLPFIYLGQWLHVGKETSFGLGKYQWSDEMWGSQVRALA